MKPREFIDACRDLLGDTYLIKLFNVGQRTLQRWTAETPYVSEDRIRENWIEKELKIIHRLKRKAGGLEIARSLVKIYAHAVDCDLVSTSSADPDKTTLTDEWLDDYPPVTKFHDDIRDNKPLSAVRDSAMRAKQEIDETLTLYTMHCEKNDDVQK